ncbi:hypothetical protein [Nostoc sp.]|uniref:hypothetical protein n=1 Tax=Nostoc sp. TaxID=1180 RepID=UPI002FFD1B78
MFSNLSLSTLVFEDPPNPRQLTPVRFAHAAGQPIAIFWKWLILEIWDELACRASGQN